MKKGVPIDGDVGVHLHEMGAGLQDDKGCMCRAPIVGKNHEDRVNEEP